jgi:hypothetical protein
MAKMMPMVSMEMDDEAQVDQILPIPMPDRPKFPPGLSICLTGDELEKMELDPTDAFVGGTIHLHAMARITSVSLSDNAPTEWSEGGQKVRIELQIEEMAIESEDEENENYDRAMR